MIHLAGINSFDSTCTFNPKHTFTIGGKIFIKAKVKRESVWKVIRDSEVEINNDKDKSCRLVYKVLVLFSELQIYAVYIMKHKWGSRWESGLS